MTRKALEFLRSKEKLVFLVIGKTGVGKTSFIRALTIGRHKVLINRETKSIFASDFSEKAIFIDTPGLEIGFQGGEFIVERVVELTRLKGPSFDILFYLKNLY